MNAHFARVCFVSLACLLPAIAAAGPPRSDAAEKKLRERLVVLKEIADVNLAAYRGGEASFTDVLPSQQEYLQAQLELTTEPAERIKILQDYVQLAKDLEKALEALVKTNEFPRVELLKAQAARLKAEAELLDEQARLKSGLK